MIRVVNRHAYKGAGIYIGRGTIWGNPYSHKGYSGTVKVDSREEAIERYKIELISRYRKEPQVAYWLKEFANAHKRGEEIVLICSCKPKACHGDVIKAAIEGIAGKDK